MQLLKKILAIFIICSTPLLADRQMAAMDTPPGAPNLRQALEQDGHPRFLSLLREAGLLDYLGKSNVTFLVPDEAYFEGLSEAKYRTILGNREALVEALKIHTLKGLLREKDLKTRTDIQTLTGENILPDDNEELGLVVNGLIVLRSDIAGPGYVIHVVDDFFIGPQDLDDPEE